MNPMMRYRTDAKLILKMPRALGGPIDAPLGVLLAGKCG
jgi:hypothetical protein